jgi:hypothetical protein
LKDVLQADGQIEVVGEGAAVKMRFRYSRVINPICS